jgi:hypothetical protein
METTSTRTATFLIIPWSLIALVTLISLAIFAPDWAGTNWNWLAVVLIVPAAVLENLKSGYSSIRVMFLKVLYTALAFFVVGAAVGIWWYGKANGVINSKLSWYFFLGAGIMLIIDLANIFSMLKAVKKDGTLTDR